MIAADDRAHLLDAVNRLRDEERIAVSCRYFLGLTDAETASVLGWREGTVKSRIARALNRLREEVSHDAS